VTRQRSRRILEGQIDAVFLGNRIRFEIEQLSAVLAEVVRNVETPVNRPGIMSAVALRAARIFFR
jgi:hypothetical protein